VRQAAQLDRRAIRAVFEQRSSATAMAQRHLDLYRRLPAWDGNGDGDGDGDGEGPLLRKAA
jgi:hypothetical protein